MGAALFFAGLHTAFFSPVLFSRRVLAPPPDAVLFYDPHYIAPVRLWDSLLMTGYPAMADPQLIAWYPPALLLRWIPGSWNVFVVLAYVLASWFMYLFVRQATKNDFAGLVSGLMFGLCGFLNVHLQHVTMIHTAAWIPAILFCLERLSGGIRRRWIALGSLSVGACILAGHPQIALYGLALAGVYAIVCGPSADSGRWRYYAASAVTFAAGVALAAIQIWPAAGMAAFTARARLSYAQFAEYALSPRQMARLLVPYLDYTSANIREATGYVGLCGLVLAVIAVLVRRPGRVLFWLISSAVSCIAAMGGATPLGRILYHLPGFGQFRAQGRFLLIFGISVAVLAGYGADALREKQFQRRNMAVAISVGLCLVVAAALIAFHRAAPSGSAPAVALVAGCAGISMIVLLAQKPESRMLRGGLLVAAVVELGAFSWFGEWRTASPNAADFAQPAIVQRLAPTLRDMHARWVPVRGDQGALAEAPGDLPVMWGLPSLSKYGPLLPARYAELLNMQPNSEFRGQWWEPESRALDIAGGRFFAIPEFPAAGEESFHGVRFRSQDLTLSVGQGCGASTASATIPISQPREIQGLALVSLTGCSVGLEQGAEVAEVNLRESGGDTISIPIRAGVETAEWAAGCADVAPAMRHRPAEIYSRFTVPRGGGVCQGQAYVAMLHLPRPFKAGSVEFRWVSPAGGILKISQLSLLGDRGIWQPLTQEDIQFGDLSRWKRLDKAAGVEVYENLRAQPRAWLVPETMLATPPQIVSAIQSSRLPDGRTYEPALVALIEEPAALRHGAPAADAKATFVEDHDTTVAIRTSSKQPAFLVLADFFYPGWRATVNGRPAPVFRTNYIQRGTLLPAGENTVRFEFRPMSFYTGAAVSLGALAAILVAVLPPRRRRSRQAHPL